VPAGGRFTIAAVFKAFDKVTAPVSRMTNKIQKSQRRIRNSLRKTNMALKRVGKTARSTFGVAGMAGAIAAAALAMGAVVTKGADFEQAIVGAGSRFKNELGKPIVKGTAAFKELADEARRVGEVTEFTATEAAGGLNFLAKAGFSAQSSLKLLGPIVDLATASELDLARAADIASDALGAFGRGSDDPTQLQRNFIDLSDKMAKTVNTANLGMEELFETIKKGGPAATAAGVPLETFLAITGQLSNAGLKASDAGTALKNVFLQLAKGSVQKDLGRLGVATKELETGELRDFADIMDDLQESIGGKSKITQAGILDQLFGKRGITAVATILATGVDGFRKYREAIEGAAGTTREMAKILRDTTRGELNVMNSAIESLALTLFELNSEDISRVIAQITEAAREAAAFAKANPEIILTAEKIAGVGLAFLVVGGIAAVVGAGVAFIFAHPVALALGAAAAAAALLLANLERIKKLGTDFFETSLLQKLALVSRFISGGAGSGFVGLSQLGGDEERKPAEFPQPAPRSEGATFTERVTEMLQTARHELRITGDTDRAELDTRPTVAGGLRISLEPSGGL